MEKRIPCVALLANAVEDYLLWMIENDYASQTISHHERLLRHFKKFVLHRKLPWDDVFTYQTLKAFDKHCSLYHATTALRGLARYLFKGRLIPSPIINPPPDLPKIYEEYLDFYQTTRGVQPSYILSIRRVLWALNEYLKKPYVELCQIRIEHIDHFLSEYNARFKHAGSRHNRTSVRGFLRYLYYERKIVKRDLAPLVVGAPQFAQAKPPKFLRPGEVKRLFESLGPESPKALRCAAMVHLAFTLGLRPKEISLISLDHISFKKAEIRVAERKSANPVKLPLPETAIKAIAAYIMGGRPKSDQRILFLNHFAPYCPVSAVTVSQNMTNLICKINPQATAYWLRHTYAQNLLEADASIFDVKQMMGHDSLQSTRRYLQIHTNLMRKVLFDETL